MTKSVIVAFDFDGTLTRSDTVVPFLRLVAREGSTMRLVGRSAARAHKAVAAIARRDRDRLRALATEAVFAGVAAADVDRLAAAYGRRIVERRLRPDTVDRLRRHRDQGHRVVIVSASYEPYLTVVADQLGVECVLSTRLETDAGGICTGRLDGDNCRADEKVRRLEVWLAEQGLTREQVELWAYGDSEGDRRLLEYADHPVWVGKRLGSVAAPA
jgi:phosphatidylglycerophosphatase C